MHSDLLPLHSVLGLRERRKSSSKGPAPSSSRADLQIRGWFHNRLAAIACSDGTVAAVDRRAGIC